MLLQRVRRFVQRHALFAGDSRVLVALSGGSDSVAMTLLLRELEDAGELHMAGAAHFNHQLRPDADRDEQFAESIARSIGIPFAAGREDVRARASRERRSIEDAGRAARYEFLDRARQQHRADVVAIGHTRDDQAETFLLRLTRGAGPRGLASIYPRNGFLVRPVLDCTRVELQQYLERRGANFVVDETNADVAMMRNRIRAELVPLLARRFNPSIVDALCREADLSREIWAWLESEADSLEPEVVREGSDGATLEIDAGQLQAAPPPLRRLLLWRAMNRMSGGRPVGLDHVDAALRLLDEPRDAGSPGTAGRSGVDAPGHRVQRVGARFVLSSSKDRAPNLFAYPLSIPGEVHVREVGCAVAAELAAWGDGAPASAASGRGAVAVVRRDLCREQLAVRNRRPGDKFRPIGLNGHKKLQDYFVDRKVAQERRDQIPLVVDGSDRIVWVAGYGIDEAFRVTDPSQSVLLLRLRQV